MALVEGIDHLVFGVHELGAGVDMMEEVLGARPVIGGRHPDFGTHNALLSLGPDVYLEVIAPDPDLPPPPRGLVFGMEGVEEARLVTWAARCESLDEARAAAKREGVDLGSISTGSRRRPDGSVLSWGLTDPYAMPLGGAVPFLISWGDSPHPAGAAPPGGILEGLRIEHPRPEVVSAALAALGLDVDVSPAETFGLVAAIRTEKGVVELR